MVARAMVFCADYGLAGDDSFIAWSPLFHMAATDHSLATLLLGGKVLVCDGLDLARIVDWLQLHAIERLLVNERRQSAAEILCGLLDIPIVEIGAPVAGTAREALRAAEPALRSFPGRRA